MSQMQDYKHLLSVAAAAALVAAPVAVDAQDPEPEGWDPEPVQIGAPIVDVEARAGVALPVGDLSAYTDPGLHVGVGAAWWLADQLAIRADGDISNLAGDARGLVSETAIPDMRLYHYGLGLELDPTRGVSESPWNFEVNAGVGGTTLDTEVFIDAPTENFDVTETFANVNGGAEIGRRVTENVLVSVEGQLFYTFIDEEEIDQLSDLRASEELRNGLSVPVTLSLRWDLPPIT